MKEDFKLLFFACPLFGVMLAIVLAVVFQGADEAAACMLGVIAGYLALIALLLYRRDHH